MKKVWLVMVTLGMIASCPAGLVDDFSGYENGNLGNVAAPPWTSVGLSTSANVLIGEEPDGNKYFAYYAPGSGVVRGGYTAITPIENTSTASTLFLRFYTETDAYDNTFGLSAKAAPGGFGDYSVMMRVRNGMFDVRSGGDFTEGVAIASNTWYNVWAVIDQTTDTFDVYLSTGTGSATEAHKVASMADFRVGTTDSLTTFMALVQGYQGAPAANKVRLDDIYVFDGAVLSNPIPEPATLLALGLGALFLRKRK